MISKQQREIIEYKDGVPITLAEPWPKDCVVIGSMMVLNEFSQPSTEANDLSGLAARESDTIQDGTDYSSAAASIISRCISGGFKGI